MQQRFTPPDGVPTHPVGAPSRRWALGAAAKATGAGRFLCRHRATPPQGGEVVDGVLDVLREAFEILIMDGGRGVSLFARS